MGARGVRIGGDSGSGRGALTKSSRSEGSNMIPVLIAIVVAFFVAGLIWLLVEWMTPKDAS